MWIAKARCMQAEEVEIQEMISEGGPVRAPESATERAKQRWPRRGSPKAAALDATQGRTTWFRRKLERVSENLGRKYLELLGGEGRMSETVRSVPKRMRKVANRTQLVVELIDDVRDGTYRDLSWRSIAIVSAGLLYSVSPADVIPEFVPFLGALDDMAVLALTTRWVKRDLLAYARFKGYTESTYF